jgi:hypothetical protein
MREEKEVNAKLSVDVRSLYIFSFWQELFFESSSGLFEGFTDTLHDFFFFEYFYQPTSVTTLCRLSTKSAGFCRCNA